MNKLVSVKQSKKNVEMYESWEDCFEDEDLHSESINEDKLDFEHKIKNMHKKIANNCQNEKCINTVSEINKLSEECVDLEKKCILIDYVKSEQMLEISEKINELTQITNKLIEKIEMYEGETLDHLEYEHLTKIELTLIKLFKKVRMRISKVN